MTATATTTAPLEPIQAAPVPPAPSADALRERASAIGAEQLALVNEDNTLKERRLALVLADSQGAASAAALGEIDARRATIAQQQAANRELLEHLRQTLVPTAERDERAAEETTAITTGTAKVTFRMPFAFSVTEVRANLNTASSSGTPTIDVKKSGTSIFSTTLTIDVSEKTSVTAATPAVLSSNPTNFSDDEEVTIDISVAGTGAKGLKLTFIGTRT